MNYKTFAIGAATLVASATNGFACTDFVLQCKDQTAIVGRSLEFAPLLPTKVKIVPRGEAVQSKAPNNQNGKKWTSKYAYAGMNIFDRIIFDGLNEKGLSVAALWFPDVKYPTINAGSPDTVIAYEDMMRWLLGNFATVAEAKTALMGVQIYAHPLPEFGNTVAPIHLAVHDAQGASLVVEFLGGKIQLFDNPIGVLTNAPEFPWHQTNLRNYIHLTPVGVTQKTVDGSVLQPTGQGTGLLGIPGDWTPPSRFVRTAVFKQFLRQPATAADGVTAAIHLLNTVDIPYGTVREQPATNVDFTQWIVVKDLTNRKLYVRTYGNQNIQTIDVAQEMGALQTQSKEVAINKVN